MPIFEDLKPLQSGKQLAKIANLPYILCNEQKQQSTLEHLTPSTNKTEKSLHLGFSVWFNLDIICKTKPFYAAVFDIDEDICNFIYPLFESLLLQCKTREEFISQFLEKIAKNDELIPFTDYLNNELQVMKNANGFLATDANFLYLVEMVKGGRIFFGKANIINNEDMALLKNWIEKNNLELNTLYLSNIPEWIIPNNLSDCTSMKKNILQFIKPQTQVIDAFYPTNKKKGSGPPQRVTLGNLPSYEVIQEKNNKRLRDSSLTKEEASSEKRLKLSRQLFFNTKELENNTFTELDKFFGV